MKKILALVAALVLTVTSASAHGFGVGIITGVSTAQDFSDLKAGFDQSALSNFHFGVVFSTPEVMGLSIQPALMLNARGNVLSENALLSNYMLELPVQVQYGWCLLGLRPYAFLEPFVGYIVADDAKDILTGIEGLQINNLQYGLGAGLGLSIGKIQLSARYRYNLGSLYKDGQIDIGGDLSGAFDEETKTAIEDLIKGTNNSHPFNGLTISLALFF